MRICVVRVRDSIPPSPHTTPTDLLGGDDATATATAPAGYRSLSAEEIAGLEARGNAALGPAGWAGVLIEEESASTASGGAPSLERVRNSRLYGRVLLPGRFGGAVEVEEGMGPPGHPTGLYDSTLADCVVGGGALVKGCGLLSRVAVGEGAVVAGNGLVACKGEGEEGATAFGCGVSRAAATTGGGIFSPL